MDNTQLKNLINSKIVENDNGEITASDLNTILNEILDSAGSSSGVSDYNDLDNKPLENTEEGGLILHGYSDGYGTYNNTANAQNAVALGRNNVVSGLNSFATGSNNTITGNTNSAIGTLNVITGGNSNLLSGFGNVLGNGSQATIFGNYNIFNNGGTNLFVAGYNNTVEPDYDYNTSDSVILGKENKAGANCVYILGCYNISRSGESVVLGSNLELNNYKEIALGRYNNSTENVTKFSIGCGSGENDRLNALEIDSDGNVYIKGVGRYDGTNIGGDDDGYPDDLATILNSIGVTKDNRYNIKDAASTIDGGSSNVALGGSRIKSRGSNIAIGTSCSTNVTSNPTWGSPSTGGATAIGRSCEANGYMSSAVGIGVVTNNVNSAVFGVHNAPDNDAILMLGCGYREGSNYISQNALMVTTDNKIYIKGIGGYTGGETGTNKNGKDIASAIPTFQVISGNKLKITFGGHTYTLDPQ